MATISLNNLQGVLAAGLDRAFTSAAMFDQMGASLLASIRRGIRAEQSPDGKDWQPLKPATVKSRGSAHPILRRRNHLYQSITYAHDSQHAQVGTNMPYARIHQLGGTVQHKAGTMPQYFSLNKKNGTLRRARKGRANFMRDVQRRAFVTAIPARPYLFNNDGTAPQSWKEPLVNIFLRSLKAAFAQGGA